DAVAGAMHADQELAQRAMRVLAANLLARYSEDQEISLHFKWHMPFHLAKRERSPQILYERQMMQLHSAHASEFAAGRRLLRRRVLDGNGGPGAGMSDDTGR